MFRERAYRPCNATIYAVVALAVSPKPAYSGPWDTLPQRRASIWKDNTDEH